MSSGMDEVGGLACSPLAGQVGQSSIGLWPGGLF